MVEPAVTIVVPVCESVEHLGACLESVLGQTFGEFEVIVVDDCPPGDVAGIVGRVAKGDHRVRLVRHGVTHGPTRARFTGAREARGQYLAFVDPDDEVEDVFIELMYDVAIEWHADLVQCEVWQIEPDGTTRAPSGPGARLVLRDGDIVRGVLGGEVRNSLSGKLIRTTAFTSIAGIDAEQGSVCFGGDILITFLLAANSAVLVGVPEHGYRRIQRSTTFTKSSEAERLVRRIDDLDVVYRLLRTLLAERDEQAELVSNFFQREFALVVTAMLRQAAACENSGSGRSPRSPAALGLLGAIILENAAAKVAPAAGQESRG